MAKQPTAIADEPLLDCSCWNIHCLVTTLRVSELIIFLLPVITIDPTSNQKTNVGQNKIPDMTVWHRMCDRVGHCNVCVTSLELQVL